MNKDSDLRLPDNLREALRKPFGKLYQETGLINLLKKESKDRKIICVGDFVASKLLKNGIRPSLIIWDKKTRRSPANEETIKVLGAFGSKRKRIKNPAGFIAKESWTAIEESLRHEQSSILVEGEEDLLVIPSSILAPIGSYILYGLPDRGIVLIVVDSNIRAVFASLLKDFVEENLR